MTSRPVVAAALVVPVLLSVAGRAAAQTPAVPPVGLRAYALVERTSLTAAETFDATLGSSSLDARGLGVEALDLWKGLFARVTWARSRETGERVVVVDREVFRLGIPMRVEVTPLEFGGGWRTRVGPGARIGVYGGAGLLRVHYRQTSDFARPEESVDETLSGATLFAGVDVTVLRWVIVGVEAQFSSVPDALGESGASQVFGDTDLGGRAVRLLVGIRF